MSSTGGQLFIDIGNSRIKTRFRINGEWSEIQTFDPGHITPITSLLPDAGLVVLSSVSQRNFSILEPLLSNIPTTRLTVDNLSAHISYDSTGTLGIDRVLAAIGAWHTLGSGCVAIDAGTATTIDLITAEGLFSGGVIMPGISLFESGLQQHTDLPAVNRSLPEQWPPRSTETALKWGITGSYLEAVRSHIRRYSEHDTSLSIVTTGGDGEWLSKQLDQDTIYIPDLVFRGMGYVV